jgi:hypothetical protein
MSDWISNLSKAISDSKFPTPPPTAVSASELANKLGKPLRTASTMLYEGFRLGLLDRIKTRRSPEFAPEFFYFEKPKPAPKKR